MTGAVPDNLDVQRLTGRLEELVLQGNRRYTAEEAADRAGMSLDAARQLWHSLGFADAAEETERVYTDADVEAMQLVQRLQEIGVDEAELRSSMTRFFGQTFSRLASMEGQILLDFLGDNPNLLEDEEHLYELAEVALPVLERLQSYVWRRQVASFLLRMAALLGGDGEATGNVAVGFADLAGFTAMTRKLGEQDFRELIECFEAAAGEVVAASGGRIVKTIGDEVLFTADDPAAGAKIGLCLLDVCGEEQRMPPLRVGIAAGPVVRRLGDVYGATVNIASRLTKHSRPGNVLVDRNMYEILADDPRYALKPLRPMEVRGYQRLHSWRLRRVDAPAG